ncbi:hypothetical protein CAEBREN_14745 [Caenorhabditis brenneri]|uniref:Serpentine receptor class r-10 n=1 Tax=Caenorhabditis brenneri TaxID=135651 RepID=G0MUK5_CAEBE|nr:hypothetical protein CAEBREN_14745 [Caenorhabditis brenneri]
MQSVHTVYQRISACLAVFNNILLIILIIYKSHRKVGKYKFLMIYISTFEIFYALVDAFGAPTIFTKDSIFLVVTYSDQVFLPDYFLKSFVELYCVFYGISMAIFAIHFIYRYLIVSENKFATKYESQVIFGLLTFPLLFGMFWLWLVRTFISPFPEADEYFMKNHLDENGINITNVKYAGVYFWPAGKDGENNLHWRSSIGIMIMTVAIVISFALILVFGFKCYCKTKQMIQSAPESTSFTKLQSQLFYALVFQTAIPVILMHIPASIAFSASFFNVSNEYLGDWCSITICLYPTLDPLPNFFMIKNYREAILNAFRTFLRKIIQCKGAKVGVQTATESEMISTSHSAAPTN